jgi:hypothetical protein
MKRKSKAIVSLNPCNTNQAAKIKGRAKDASKALNVCAMLCFYLLLVIRAFAQTTPIVATPNGSTCWIAGSCFTNELDISTGVDHVTTNTSVTTSLFASGNQDDYWTASTFNMPSLPVGSYYNGVCTTAIIGSPFIMTKCRAITLPSGISQPPSMGICAGGLCVGPSAWNGNSATFTRKFELCEGGDIKLEFIVAADNYIRDASLEQWVAGGGGYNHPITLTSCNVFNKPYTAASTTYSANLISVPAGIYYLSFRVENEPSACNLCIASGNSNLWFQLQGKITALPGTALIKNAVHDGNQTTGYVSPMLPLPHIKLATTANPCVYPVALDVEVGGVLNTNLAAGFGNKVSKYEIIAGSGTGTVLATYTSGGGTAPPYLATAAGSYRVRSTDIYGCFWDDYVFLSGPSTPTLPSPTCVSPAGTSVTFSPSAPPGVSWKYTLKNLTTGFTHPVQTNNATFGGVKPGNHELVIVDATTSTSTCSTSAIFKIGTLASAYAFTLSPNTCIPAIAGSPITASTATITASVPASVILPTYNFATIGTPLGFVPNSPALNKMVTKQFGIYTITVTDFAGCTKSTTLIIKNEVIASTTTPPCIGTGLPTSTSLTFGPILFGAPSPCPTGSSSQFPVLSTTVTPLSAMGPPPFCPLPNPGAYSLATPISQYFWPPAGTGPACATVFNQWSLSLNPPASTASHNINVVLNTNHYCTPSGAGVLQVPVTVSKCGPATPCVLPAVYTLLAGGAGTKASTIPIIAGGTWPTTPVYVTGTIILDNNTTIANNPDVYFGPGAKLVLASGPSIPVPHIVTIDNCNLRSCGPDMWDGIYAGTPSTQLITITKSTLEDMHNGLVISGNGKVAVQVDNNLFRNNGKRSIFLDNWVGSTYVCYGKRSYFTNNTFTSNLGSLKAPYNLTDYSSCGIEINEKNDITIGYNPTTLAYGGNDFRALRSGIVINPYLTGVGAPSAAYKLYDNNFYDIFSANCVTATNMYQQFDQPYTTSKGTAIFYNGAPFTTATMLITPSPGMAATRCIFNNVDKGIVASSLSKLEINSQIMENEYLGIAIDKCFKETKILANTISNAHLGISTQSCALTVTDVLDIHRNTITTKGNAVNRSVAPTATLWPIGIKCTNGSTAQGTSKVLGNVVTMRAPSGICFNMSNVGKVELASNFADMTNTSFTNTPTSLYTTNSAEGEVGYSLTLCPNMQFFYNNARGNFTSTTHTKKSVGLFVDKNLNPRITCNRIEQTRYGFYIQSNNKQATGVVDQIAGNQFNANMYPWYSNRFATFLGTFADVGKASSGSGSYPAGLDANNQFYDPTFAPTWATTAADLRAIINGTSINIYRTPVGVLTPVSDKVHQTKTSIYTPASSYCNVAGKEYKIPANTLNNYLLYTDCDGLSMASAKLALPTTPAAVSSKAAPIDATVEREMDEDIALDNNDYEINEDLLKWIDEYNLFAKLTTHTQYRDNVTALANFYTTANASNIAKMFSINKQLNELGTLYGGTDSVAYQQAYHNLIVDIQTYQPQYPWEAEEMVLNNIILQNEISASTPLSEQDATYCENIANTCYYNLGNAVIKARSIMHAMVPSITFNERLICAGSAKMSIDEEDYMADRQQMPVPTIIPNPNNGKFQLRFTGDHPAATLNLYNTLGVQCLTHQIPAHTQNEYLNLSNQAAGFYTYKLIFADKTSSYGKIQITNE